MKTFRDPVHNIIQFDKDSEKLLLDLIDTREFQRLRHIKQLGLSSFTYPGAEHTRFAHSLGVTHLMKRLIDKIYSLKVTPDCWFADELRDNKMLALVSALLHDIGHGPFSHALEKTTKIHHEAWTTAFIKGNTEVNSLLEGHRTGFANEVAEVIRRTHTSRAVVKLLSSQLDTDRIDYLLRDSLMTGAGYGSFDLEWLINVLRIGKVNEQIEVGLDLTKGLSIAEDFIMARYYMYVHVYFHKTTRSVEMLVERIFKRAIELSKEGTIELPRDLKDILTNGLNPETIVNYLDLTENTMWFLINLWKDHPDRILSDLCNRLLHRNLYKSITPPDVFDMEFLDKVMKLSEEVGIPFDYLVLQDDASSSFYKDTYLVQPTKPEEKDAEREASQQIFFFDKSGNSRELASESKIINVIRNQSIKIIRYYVPAEFKDRF
jgi:hypothetical protein